MSHHHHAQQHIIMHAICIRTNLSHTGPGAAKHILARDRARAQKLLAGLHPHGPLSLSKKHGRTQPGGGTQEPLPADPPAPGSNTIDVTDAGVTYTMQVGVGTPPTEYTLLIDTGSSNTWVGAGKKYVHTSSSKKTGDSVSVTYGSGSFKGFEFTDTVTLGKNLIIQNQSIGVATTSTGFNDVDGILGIGPVDLTEGTLSSGKPIPTVTDNLASQGTIPENSIGILYEPTTGTDIANGELTFGGIDTAKITGEISFVPITQTSPANNFWGIDQTITYVYICAYVHHTLSDTEHGILSPDRYGTGTKILSKTAGIVDTGTTLLLLATDAFKAYEKATGGVLDQATGLLTITQTQFNNLKSLFFEIGNVTYELTANAQIWPRAQNEVLGGDPNKIYLVTADLGNIGDSGLDFIDGFVFLQRFYSVYDTTNAQVGLATTQFTNATTN
ncbi:acid protease [Rickenella mellea]|uniref:Acid protease n=1 Tax=Rickenella mellea TaxID=50990 RepID=A0A4Y7Q8Q4_9AGAM|nr:acid protease [Rickenella mellea]